MKLRKILALGLIATMTIAFTACGSKESGDTKDTDNKKDETSVEAKEENTTEETDTLSGTVVITGSTSVEKIIIDMIDEFQAINPDVKVNYTGTGSSAGLTPDVFAYDGIAAVIHPSNEVSDIKLEDLAKIYSGELTNWKQLGGKDSEIVVVSREGSSGTRDAFEELIGLEDAGGLTEGATVIEGNGNVQTSVAGNENAIGYVSFSFINETVKGLTIDGIEATPEKVKAGDYKLSRPFLLTSIDANLSKEGRAFLEFAKSEDGQTFVEAHGGIVIN